ncbi:retrovirus-related pol polyprotein from transposon TNT 1-94, partial [Tanacetum coccineum]
MTRNLKLLINFVWKFLGTVRFGNDHVAAVMDLEVTFRRNTCFVRNLKGIDLLKGNHITNLYTIHLQEMASTSPICLIARATSTKSWLWHQLGKKQSINPQTQTISKLKAEATPASYGFMRADEIQNYQRSKDEAPEEIKTFLKKIQVLLQAIVIIIRTDNETEFKNQVLQAYFDILGISHQTSPVRTPQQNGVIVRRNRTLVEAARTMLIYYCALLFLWVEAIATACYTQNSSLIHRRFDKIPYELINGRKLDISFLHVFGALCYPKNDCENIGKLSTKGDIGFFIGYSTNSCAYKVFNRRTKKIMETMNVTFDELSAIAFKQRTDTTPTPTNSSLQATNILNTLHDVDELQSQQHDQQQDDQAQLQPEAVAKNVPNAMFDGNTFVNPFAPPSTSFSQSSSQYVDP